MRVLYVNHTPVVSGSERSLLTLLQGLPSAVDPVLACPPGELSDKALSAGVAVVAIRGTAGSLRLHPIHSARAVADIARSALDVRAAAKQAHADILHANTIRAGLITTAARRAGGPPLVAHVRDRLPPGRLADLTLSTIVRGASVVIANSRYTAARLPPADNVRVIHNPVDLKQFDPAAVDGRSVRARLGLGPEAFVSTVVAQLTPWKGQDVAIRAVSELAGRRPELRLLIVGSHKFMDPATRLDNRAYVDRLHELVAELAIADRVRFLGERRDVPDLLAATDVLLAPSAEEPFGRSIAEAMAMGVPVIATEIGGPAEIVRPGVDGVLLPPHAVERWAGAIDLLIDDARQRVRMGAAGRERAVARFGMQTHVSAVLDAYAAANSKVSTESG